MNVELYIAKRILRGGASHRAKPVVNIALLGIALGLAVMIVALAIATGFRTKIQDKVIGFGSHIQITNYDMNVSYEPNPISIKQPFYPHLDTVEGIRKIQVFATKAGIIKTDTEIYSVVIKGVDSDFDWSFFKQNLVEGKILGPADIGTANDVIISKYIADMLHLGLENEFVTYFIDKQNRIRARRFLIRGIYETGLEEYDKHYVLADIAHIQKLNGWSGDQVGGFEVLIDNFGKLDEMGEYVNYNVIGAELFSQTIKEVCYQVFDWLGLQDMNVQIILTLMLLVSVINMVSAILVLILERTSMIGILKALGAYDWNVRRIFLYIASMLLLRGLVLGNIIGLALCLIQYYFEPITLDQESYYVSVVPVQIDFIDILLLNTLVVGVCLVTLLLPSQIIARITPVKAIRFS